MSIDNNLIKQLTEFRHRLHRFPELSGCEIATSKTILDFIAPTNPSKVIPNIGGYGLAAIYDSGNPGPTVMLRSDMDALPIQESNKFDYKSAVEGVGHLCGHDGHSAILAGVGYRLSKNLPPKGKVVLLFQPAEEIGQGAAAVISDTKFKEITPDFTFAFHNLPGFEEGSIFLRDGTFASASTGMIIKLKGLSSHAAHPEDGNNPDRAMASLIMGLNSLAKKSNGFKDFTLLTVIHAKLGDVAFGTTPGHAVVMATLRTYLDSDMGNLKRLAEELVDVVCKEHKLNCEISYTEDFPATNNSRECNQILKRAAKRQNISTLDLELPFRWSEDFGHFTQKGNASLFGIGSGVNHPQLHNEDYDFPDGIIESAVNIFEEIIKDILVDH